MKNKKKYEEIKPFWNDKCKQVNSRLWNMYEGLNRQPKSKHYDRVRTHTYGQNEDIFKVDIKKPDNIFKDGFRCKKVKLNTTATQRQVLKKFFSSFRKTYNDALYFCKYKEKIIYEDMHHYYDDLRQAKKDGKLTEDDLKIFYQELDVMKREKYLFVYNSIELNKIFGSMKNKKGEKNIMLDSWNKDIPSKLRQEACRDLCKARTTCASQYSTGQIKSFKLGYKKKEKELTKSISVTEVSLKNKKISFYPNSFNENERYFTVDKKVHNKEWFKNLNTTSTCRLLFDGMDYFLYIPIKTEKKDLKQTGTVALDPGARTFMTGFSHKEVIIAKEDKKKIEKLYKRVDKYKSLKSKNKLTNSTVKILKTNKKIRNHVDNLHWELIHNLTRNYKNILIPLFQTKDMTKNLHKKTNRDLSMLRHFTFRQRLLSKASLTNTNVYVVTEEYTSQTCSKCGHIQDIGSKKSYNCQKCSFSAGRDENGARNIYIKHMKI